MIPILFTSDGNAISPSIICENVAHFDYKGTASKIIRDSEKLDIDGEVFIKCAATVLSNFKMTRSGVFKGIKAPENETMSNNGLLVNCWEKVGTRIYEVHDSIMNSGYPRIRYLLEVNQSERDWLVGQIWSVFKDLLPFTMGKTAYGLVGASKILFSVLPEVILPIDNVQWLHVFKTVDIGDVIKGMALEIEHWEDVTGKNLLNCSTGLATLPSVYNVMAMAARPRS